MERRALIHNRLQRDEHQTHTDAGEALASTGGGNDPVFGDLEFTMKLHTERLQGKKYLWKMLFFFFPLGK